jgi:FKBP-type peptidyl-prolyl cis-trans isomerase SlyD
LNHPHAGKDLNFKGEVVTSRPATTEEIQSLLHMLTGEGGCGGCCGGDCDGGCGDHGCGGCH